MSAERKETFVVQGMTCGGCEKSVTRALSALDGVVQVEASHSDDKVEVVVADDGPDRERLGAAIEDAGFDVVAA